MSEDQQMPMTLAIDDSGYDLAVVNISGTEALNESYSFTVDVISREQNLHSGALEQRCAWLAFGAKRGVHGKITGVTCLYDAANLHLYRVQLGPRLLDMDRGPRRRLFNGLSVPHILRLLLTENGLSESDYRFDQMVGTYPARPLCVQHGESDLHLLHRLCEEEGIHFRFEHSPANHCVIFADDPASFAQRLLPMRFQVSDPNVIALRSISYLAERWLIHPACTDPGLHHHERVLHTQTPLYIAEAEAPNERFDASLTSQLPSEEYAHERQVSARELERQRCERRVVLGRSDDYVIGAGLIVQVLDHPVSAFNDQWLMTEVTHAAKQPQVLEGLGSADIVAIEAAIAAPTRNWFETPSPPAFDTEPFSQGYRNHFRVVPWEMAYRPTLRHRKPLASNLESATLLSGEAVVNEADQHGRLPISFACPPALEMQPQSQRSQASFPAHLIDGLRTDASLLIGHFGGNADCPSIVELADSDADLPPFSHGALRGIQATQDLTLATQTTTFKLTADCITVTSSHNRLTVQDRFSVQPVTEPEPDKPFDTDLRLTQQDRLEGEPYSNRLWYIVRMPRPGLDYVAWLEPEHFLLEGKTDEHGNLGLDPRQLRQLAEEYRATPDNICLVHPGFCIVLKDWFEENWSQQQFQDFLDQD
ncbi:Rhs element Vgr protein [Paucimonas lemoignei]|nr:Rhs element Vgr protein [Paucimonas lemoignei]